jgi:hypothetical protein
MNKISKFTKVVPLEEVVTKFQLKAENSTKRWEEFLGAGPYNNIHPVYGTSEVDRLYSADGTRSIRFTKHEMNSLNKTRAHYHEELWVYNEPTDTMYLHNISQRLVYKIPKNNHIH